MVKHLNSDNPDDIKSYLQESLKEVMAEEVKPESAKLIQALEDHNGEFVAQYKAAKEFMEEILTELNAAIDQNRQIEALDLFVSELYLIGKHLSNNNEMKESFMDKMKDLYNQVKGNGLLDRLAVLGTDSISPELGQLLHLILASQENI